MKGFKINCTMCNGNDTELYEKNIYDNFKIIGYNIYFICNECQWEELFHEIRYPVEEIVNMKIMKIIVNELPKNCSLCTLHEDEYCKIKGNTTGSEWIDLCSDFRDGDCPLEVE